MYCLQGHLVKPVSNATEAPRQSSSSEQAHNTHKDGSDEEESGGGVVNGDDDDDELCVVCDDEPPDASLFPCCSFDQMCGTCYKEAALHQLTDIQDCRVLCVNPQCFKLRSPVTHAKVFRDHCHKCGVAIGGTVVQSAECQACRYEVCTRCFEDHRRNKAGVPLLVSQYFQRVRRIDVDTGLGVTSSSSPGRCVDLTSVALAEDCDFIHYGCFGINDSGWGCCYRALQMVLAQIFRRDRRFEMPSIIAIQKHLVNLKPDAWKFPTRWTELTQQNSSKVNSSTWMEPPDAAAVLRSTYGIPCEELQVVRPQRSQASHCDSLANTGQEAQNVEVATLSASTTDAQQHTEQLLQLWRHLGRHFGNQNAAPIIIDDVTFAYAVAGVAESSELASPPQEQDQADNEESRLPTDQAPQSLRNKWILLFDPHISVKVCARCMCVDSCDQFDHTQLTLILYDVIFLL